MMWDGGMETLVVTARWALLGVALGGEPVWPCGTGVGFTERSVRSRFLVIYEAMKRKLLVLDVYTMCGASALHFVELQRSLGDAAV